MEHERSLEKRFVIAGSNLRAYWRLAIRYRTPHYLVADIAEAAKDFIAWEDTMLEKTTQQLTELQKKLELEAITDHSEYIQ